MADRPADITEADVVDVLGGIAATAHTLRVWVREAGPVIEALVADYPPAAALLRSLAAANAVPAALGTPRHLEEQAAAILRDLGASGPSGRDHPELPDFA